MLCTRLPTMSSTNDSLFHPGMKHLYFPSSEGLTLDSFSEMWLQYFLREWCSPFVGRMLQVQQVLTRTPHMDKSGGQVRSCPFKCNGSSINGRFKVARQCDVITNWCYDWLKWTNDCRLTWGRNRPVLSLCTCKKMFHINMRGSASLCRRHIRDTQTHFGTD